MHSSRIFAFAAVLLLGSGCGTEPGDAGDGSDSLPDDTYQRVLSQGADPALVYTIDLDGFELAEQSAGVLGDSDYGAVYVPTDPPFTAEVHLVAKGVSYDGARCDRDPLSGPSGATAALKVSCEPEAGGWYRSGDGWHEYVVRGDGHHLTVGAPSDAVDRAALTKAALGARHQDGTIASPATPSSPVTRGDLPSNGDGAPINPSE